MRTEIQTGVRDGEWIEVTNRHVESKSPVQNDWVPIEPSAQVLVGQALDLDRRGHGRVIRIAGDSPTNSSQTQRLEQRGETDGSKTFRTEKTRRAVQARKDTATTASPVPPRVATKPTTTRVRRAASMAGSR